MPKIIIILATAAIFSLIANVAAGAVGFDAWGADVIGFSISAGATIHMMNELTKSEDVAA